MQEDVRVDKPALRDLDRVLLHLGWDDAIQWGNAGEMNVLIRREDLLAGEFDRVWFTADCS